MAESADRGQYLGAMGFSRWRWYHVLFAWLVFAATSVLLVRGVLHVERAESASGDLVEVAFPLWPLALLAVTLAVMIALTIEWVRSK
jgi:hypothetical protein